MRTTLDVESGIWHRLCMKTPRAAYTYTLPVDVAASLAQRSKETGDKMSRLVEEALRALLALPIPEVEEEGGKDSPLSANEKTTLEALVSLGPGPQFRPKLVLRTGFSKAVIFKHLRSLERRGLAFCWGAGDRNSDGTFALCWSAWSPLETVQKVARLRKSQGYEYGGIMGELTKWLRSLDDQAPVFAFLIEFLGLPEDYFHVLRSEFSNVRSQAIVDDIRTAERSARELKTPLE